MRKNVEGIELLRVTISGILHPKIVVDTLQSEDDVELEIWTEKGKCILEVLGSKYGRRKIYSALLSKSEKNVTIFVIRQNEKVKIASLKNTIFRRAYSRFMDVLRRPSYLFKRVITKFNPNYYNPFHKHDFYLWTQKVEEKPIYHDLSYQPLISILIPVYNIQREYLSECLDSILKQHYQNFEICLVDDCSTLEETKETLEEYRKKDSRIKVKYREVNGHISKTTNDALQMASGEFVALMDNDDVLTENALYEMVDVLNQRKDYDLIYSDEDKLDMEGNRCEPHFKPDYSPDSLFGGNYICHFEILRKSIMDEIGGFRSEYVGAQDFDLFLRFCEKTTPDKIYHIPKILYHWRKVPGSTADTIENKDYAILNGQKAVEDALIRRKMKGSVLVPIHTTHYVVQYRYEKEPKVSIFMFYQESHYFQKCIETIYRKTNYQNYEIIVLSEQDHDFLKTFQKEHSNFFVYPVSHEKKKSVIYNEIVQKAHGDLFLFLDNVLILQEDWLAWMVGYALQKHIGVVGAKILFPNETIQNGGIVVGPHHVSRLFYKEDAYSYGFYGRLLVPYNYSVISSTCMMVQKKKFLEANGFQENFQTAYYDYDFSLKLRELGYYNVLIPQVEVYNYEKISPSKKDRQYFRQKWGNLLKDDPCYNSNLSLKKTFYLAKRKERK